MVMKMNTYKIIMLKDEFKKYVYNYPKLLRCLSMEQKTKFDTSQIELLLKNTSQAVSFFEKDLFLREDYLYFHGLHKLTNEITNDSITFIINEFDIEVNEKKGSYIVFDYLKKFSSNFFMFDIE